MDGRGRAADNIFVERLWRTIKYEDIYLKDYTTMDALHRGLTDFFAFYNEERPHQSLDYQTPSVVHATAVGGGALIVDRYGNPASQAELTSPRTGLNPIHASLT
jgi:putative transposase